jgi:CheY-like chemotaxis protein
MPVILLADDSPHAQRMGEKILREEGYEVISAVDGGTALRLLDTEKPQVILADVFLPGVSGYELCQRIRSAEGGERMGVVLTAGLLEPVDEAEAARVKSDGVLRKPFEATEVLQILRPLVARQELEEPSAGEVTGAAATVGGMGAGLSAAVMADLAMKAAAQEEALARGEDLPASEVTEELLAEATPVEPEMPAVVSAEPEPLAQEPVVTWSTEVVNPERVRAAVTLALDAAMPALIEELTERVLIALRKTNGDR